jgi:hypothetical protein
VRGRVDALVEVSHSLEEHVDLFVSGVERERWMDGPLHAEAAGDGLGWRGYGTASAVTARVT